MEQKFSIVVPTRERANTLRSTLESCVAQQYENLSIIVSDNFSQDNTREVVEHFTDPRIRYVNPGQRLSMARSFEFALSHIDSGYVVTLGDDDGLAVNAIVRANEILNTQPSQALTVERAQYDWPGMAPQRQNQISFSLRNGWEARQTRDFYLRVVNGWLSYYQIPLIYQCFFSYDVVAKVIERTGRIFRSQQLDIYSSILFGGIVPSYLHCWEPLIINGASPKSNGAQHFGAVKDETEKKKWDTENDLPLRAPFQFARSIRLLIAESYLQAIDAFPEIGEMPIDLAGVLTRALIEVHGNGNSADAVVVAEVAQKLGVQLRASGLGLQARVLARRADRYVKWLANLRRTLILDCGQNAVSDIAGAARLMHAALNSETDEQGWSLRDQITLAARRR